MSQCIHFFVHTNGPMPLSLYASNFQSLEHQIRLSGYPHRVLQEVISGLCQRAMEEGDRLALIHHPLDNSLQGVILENRKTGVFGFDAWDRQEHNYLAATENGFLGEVQTYLTLARDLFTKARTFHNDQEKIYISHMNFQKADALAEETISSLLPQGIAPLPGRELHRFFGAATADGNLDYIPEITCTLDHRYFIKGRPGTGKSTFLKKIASAAKDRGLDVEIYHCSLDPNSLDMVIVRQLGLCLLDSTSPHEYFPTRPGDEIIDLYEACVDPLTDENHAPELAQLQTSYKSLLWEAVAALQEAKKAAQAFDSTMPPPHPKTLAEITKELANQILI